MKKRVFIIFILLFLNIFVCYKLYFYNKNYVDIDSLYGKSLNEISKVFLYKYYLDNGSSKTDFLNEPSIFLTNNFDCLTFVETVLAFHISSNFNELFKNLIKIKYKYESIDFFQRNHFITVDWIKNNEWLLKNITKNISKEYKTKNVEINKKNWFITQYKNFYDYLVLNNKIYKMDNFDTTIENIDYIPYQEILLNKDFIEKLPNASIIFIVKDFSQIKEKLGTDLDVSHTGFLFKEKSKLHKYFKFIPEEKIIFRHASSLKGKVVEENFLNYIKKILEMSNKFQGIIILTLNDRYE